MLNTTSNRPSARGAAAMTSPAPTTHAQTSVASPSTTRARCQNGRRSSTSWMRLRAWITARTALLVYQSESSAANAIRPVSGVVATERPDWSTASNSGLESRLSRDGAMTSCHTSPRPKRPNRASVSTVSGRSATIIWNATAAAYVSRSCSENASPMSRATARGRRSWDGLLRCRCAVAVLIYVPYPGRRSGNLDDAAIVCEAMRACTTPVSAGRRAGRSRWTRSSR
jgi:hypothetical protein